MPIRKPSFSAPGKRSIGTAVKVANFRQSSSRLNSDNAGGSAAARFHEERIQNLRREWKLWLAFAGLAALSVVFMAWFGTTGLVLGGWMLGFITAVCLFGWKIGFDVHALTWLWGSWGEEDTANELARLGDDWYVRHDIPSQYGNWDHVAIGPAGVFMIETKRLRGGRISVNGDGLSSGRLRFTDRSFRGAAVGLRTALVAKAPSCPFVQAVVAVWGDFPAEPQERERVVYVSGSGLAKWLDGQPPKIDDDRRLSVVAALQSL